MIDESMAGNWVFILFNLLEIVRLRGVAAHYHGRMCQLDAVLPRPATFLGLTSFLDKDFTILTHILE